nr:mannosyl-oligosaccharide 1,2-alpha-mannosidase MNS3 [Tanacetum cinerariifolium]
MICGLTYLMVTHASPIHSIKNGISGEKSILKGGIGFKRLLRKPPRLPPRLSPDEVNSVNKSVIKPYLQSDLARQESVQKAFLHAWSGCVLTQETLDAFCNTFYIPEEVHPILPNQDDTMHERHAGKIGLYTRFFDFANFRLPLSTFFVDIHDFACPAFFSWHTAKHVIRDPAPVAADFNAQDYATLVAHPSPFQKYPEAFLCLVGLSRHYTLDEDIYPWFVHKNGEDMDLFAFIHSPNPTKVRVVKREREVDEPRLLDTIVGRTVPLLPVAFDHADSELEASVERLFDEGSIGTQTEQENSARGGPDADIQLVIGVANIVTEDAAPVRLRRQGKRKYVAVDAGGASHPPKKLREDHGTPSGTSVAASMSSTSEREDEDHTNSVAEPNLRTIGASQRSSTPVMTTATTVTFMVDSTLVAKERTVKPSLFAADSSSAGRADPNTGVFSDLFGSNFLVGGIRTVIDPDTNLQKVYVPQWSVTNGSRLDDGHVCLGAARQMPLSAEVRMRAEYNVKERRRLQSVVEKKDELLKAKDGKIENLKALADQVYKLEVSSAELQEKITVYDNCMEQLEKFQGDRMKRWLLTHGLKLFLVKCFNSSEYLTALGAAISHVIEKGMQSGLAAGIDYGREGKSLVDIDAYNPDAEVDFNTALQELREVEFLLLAELKSYKDASTDDIMNVLRLEGAIVDAPGMNDLQPNIEQLKVPIHRSEDSVVLGETPLSFVLSVSHSHVERTRENIAAQPSALVGVWTPLSEPLSVTNLMGTEGTSNVMPTTADTTTVLSTTLSSASIIAPISVDDYEVIGMDDQAGANRNAEPFPNVDDAELNIP